jgi:Na+-transporting NADH:ubiquinone oxidoreductase subunit NqrF
MGGLKLNPTNQGAVMSEFQTELTKEQKEKLLRYTCQVAVIHNHLMELEETVELDCDLQSELASTGYHVHTAKIKLMGLVVP